MSEYENRIYDTLTATEEKFASAYEIANHMGRVKKKLIKDFWEAVYARLDSLIKEKNSDFTLHIDPDISDGNSKCSLSLKGNTDACFVYEHLSNDLTKGLRINQPKIDYSRLIQHGKNVIGVSEDFSEKSWWFMIEKPQIDFSKMDSLALILPNKAEERSTQMADSLFDLADKNREHLDFIIKHCLK
jgi:hypothetical protein